MKTVSVPTRIDIDLDREYMELSNRLGVPVSNLRRQVLQNPELKINYSIETLLKEKEELEVEIAWLTQIKNEGIKNLLKAQKEFNKLVLEIIGIEDKYVKDILIEIEEEVL